MKMTRKCFQGRHLCSVGLFAVLMISLCYLYGNSVLEEKNLSIGPTHSSSRVEILRSTTPSWGELRKPLAYPNEDLYFDSTPDVKKRLPTALIIGVKKAGTRALINSLAMHPTIKACLREVHFFDIQENYDKGLKWYREQMPLSHPGQITMEKTPAYFVTEGVPSRVHKMSKSIKLLVVVRDPTTRAISEFAHMLYRHHGNVTRFEKHVTSNLHESHLQPNEYNKMVKKGVYIRHLENWLMYFPMDQLHFVSGEKFVKNPVYELRMVEKFLGIKPYFNEKLFYFNETKGFPCFVSKIAKKQENTADVECLPESRKGRPHPAVREDLLKMLQDYYRPFNKKFYNVVGRDFGWDK